MLTSLALIFLVGLAAAALCARIGLPRIIGMLLAGMLLGPHVLGLLDPSILSISADLRRMALVIILIKAGLSLSINDLRKIGRPALLMSFLPALFELLAVVLLAPRIFGVTVLEAAILGAVLSAVSPAVVVPRMVALIEEKRGTGKAIPQLILAGASLDDVFVIVLFSSFTTMAQGGRVGVSALLGIPVSMVSGTLLGMLTGALLAWFFACRHARGKGIRSSVKVILLLAVSFLLLAAEEALEGIVPLSGLLAVMSTSITLAMRSAPCVVDRLKAKFGKLWLAAEAILFVLVGAAVDIRYTLSAGPGAVVLIALALLFRSAGVLLCLPGTPLNRRERLYCVIAYLPKATVQAAIGSVPLAMGLPCGSLVLSVFVLAILITAPLGAILMDRTRDRLLEVEP